MSHGILANMRKKKMPWTSGSQTLACNAITWELVRKANVQVDPESYKSEILGVLQPVFYQNPDNSDINLKYEI